MTKVYFRPKNVIFHTRFQTWSLRNYVIITQISLFLPSLVGREEIRSPLKTPAGEAILRYEQQQNIFLKIHFEIVYFSLFLTHLELKR